RARPGSAAVPTTPRSTTERSPRGAGRWRRWRRTSRWGRPPDALLATLARHGGRPRVVQHAANRGLPACVVGRWSFNLPLARERWGNVVYGRRKAVARSSPRPAARMVFFLRENHTGRRPWA